LALVGKMVGISWEGGWDELGRWLGLVGKMVGISCEDG